MKALIVSFIFPPCATGAATVMYNLCKNLPKNSYTVITTSKELSVRLGIYDKDYEIDCKTVRLPVRTTGRFDLFAFPILTILKGLFVKKEEKFDCILAVHPFFYGLLGAYILHRLVKKPLIIFMHDLFSEKVRDSHMYGVWSSIEKRIFLSASRILVMNEEYIKNYSQRGIYNTTIFPPSIDLDYANDSGNNQNLRVIEKGKLNVVYTGSVYAAQENAVLSFLETTKNHKDLKILFATPYEKTLTQRRLKELLANVNIGFLEKKECLALQKQADVLLLALSSNSPYPEEVKCAFPCKLLEYLAAGKPILALAPKKSFVESFIKKHNVGVAVNDLSAKEIINALNELADETKRNIFSQNAIKTARLFDSKKWAEKLVALMNGIVSSKG